MGGAVDISGNIFEDVAIKAPVRVATIAAITLAGLQTIDTVALNAGDRVLVKSQTDARTNGIYTAQSGIWQRSTDASDNTDFVTGTRVTVGAGALNTSADYVLTTADNPIVLGTSLLTWQQRAQNGILDDITRRAVVLDHIRAAKAIGSVQKFPDAAAEGFGGSDGINIALSTGYALDAGNRRLVNAIPVGAQIPQATGAAIGDMTSNGGLAVLFDGNTAQSLIASATALANNCYGGKNYGGSPQQIAQAIVYGSTVGLDGQSAPSTVGLTLYGRAAGTPANGTDGTILGFLSVGESGLTQTIVTLPSNDPNTFWADVWVAGTTTQSVSPELNWAEIQFFNPGPPSNITVVSQAWAADYVPATIRILAVIEPIDIVTLNTDVTCEVSRDGGTHFTAAPLTQYHGLGTQRLVESAPIDVSAQSAASSIVIRFKSLNGKRVNFHGYDALVSQ